MCWQSVSQSVCDWAVGRFGSTVLIRGEPITWPPECFAIGFVRLRWVTLHGVRPSPLLLYGQRASSQSFFVDPYSASPAQSSGRTSRWSPLDLVLLTPLAPPAEPGKPQELLMLVLLVYYLLVNNGSSLNW